MILVIDTYNVLHVVGVLPPEQAGIDLAGLIHLIQQSRYGGDRVELVCDGRPQFDTRSGPQTASRIRIRYAGLAGSQDADALIAALIARSTAPKRLIVVSSDNWIIRQARRRRCKTLSSEQFLSQIAADTSSDRFGKASESARTPTSAEEVSSWIEYFRLTPKEIQSGGSPSVPPPKDSSQPPQPAPPQSTEPSQPTRPVRDDSPLPDDIIQQAERIWSEHGSA